MAAPLAIRYHFFNSIMPRNHSERQFKIPETNQNPRSVTKARNLSSTPVPKKQAFGSNKSIEPRHITQTRVLQKLVVSGSMDRARYFFEEMNLLDTYIWNVMIRGFINNGLFEEALEFYRRMVCEGFKADYFTYPFVIKACGGLSDLSEGEKVHARLFKTGLNLDVYVCNSLIVMYMNLGCVQHAERVFEEMPERDLVSWNSIIGGYSTVGYGSSSLACFREMQKYGIKHDRFSMIGALGASYIDGYLRIGKEIHCQVIKSELQMDVMVQNSLVDMYGKCGAVDYAERLFTMIFPRTIVTWNVMIGGYVLNDHFLEAFFCLREMQKCDNLNPDCITMINLLPSCIKLGALLEGKSIHGYAITKGFLPHVVMETALLDMYGRCGELKMAEQLFGSMIGKNLVSWNAMIAAYVQNGKTREAFELFHNLCSEPLEPDATTFASVLPAYAEIATLSEGMQIHALINKLGLVSNTFISNSIVYMYAKCGDHQTARIIFDGILCKDIVSWNVIIMAYAIHGMGNISIQLFHEMIGEGIAPNESTFVSLLSSCSVSGLVVEGWNYFNSMRKDYGIDPGIEHYGCMIDLLGRTRNLDQAKRFIGEMPLVPTARIWGALLTAGRKNNDIVLAEFAARDVLSSAQDNTGCYILLSNMYAEHGRWEDVERIKAIMEKEGLEKTTSSSIFEKNGKTHRFINQDRSHDKTNLIYDALDIISRKIGEDTYIHNVSKFSSTQLMKKRATSPEHHSVRLAISFGLISTAVGNPVLVRNNTRICEHCHRALKKISEVTKRELVVRDPNVFHHFKDGCCSCGDYW